VGEWPQWTYNHAISIDAPRSAAAIELGRSLGRLPKRIEVYGIEGRRFEAVRGLSPEVRLAVDEVTCELEARFEGPGAAPA
jgi:hypothetical protein